MAIDHVSLGYSLDGRIVSAFAPLRAAGYDFRYAADGEPYQILVTRLYTLVCDGMVGYWDRTRQAISIAPQCLETEAQLRHAIVHEGLHALGARHICRERDEIIERRRVGDDCFGGAFAPAVLNPFTQYGDSVSPSELTDLDLRELRRVGAIP